MKLDDVLAAAGDHQLSGFEWGVSAVILVNSLVPPDCHIDISHTGREARTKLRSAPSKTLLTILVRDVQLSGSSVEFLPLTQEAAACIPPTVPPAGARRMSPVAVALLIVMSFIGLALTWSSIQVSRDTGQVSEHESLKVIIQSMTEIVKQDRESKTE